MKKRMMSLLLELLKDSKRSDRELAKVLGVSQPTITRLRHKLEKNGMIRDYTIVPDLKKMGFELLVINFAKIRPEILSPETREKAGGSKGHHCSNVEEAMADYVSARLSSLSAADNIVSNVNPPILSFFFA